MTADLKRHLFNWLQKELDGLAGPLLADRLTSERRAWQQGDALRGQKYAALRALVARQPDRDQPLGAYELSVFSQNGEDGVIAELCSRLDPPHSFVEFGIERGYQGNCILLADVFGWSGLFIEANKTDYEHLRTKYGLNTSVSTLNAAISRENINELFAEAGVPRDLGILSIDVDGNDYWVWKALEGYSPAILIIEYNSALPDANLVQPYGQSSSNISRFFGASLQAMEELGRSKGYRLVHTDLAGVNAFFVREDLAEGLTGEPIRHGLNYFLMGTVHEHSPSERSDWVES